MAGLSPRGVVVAPLGQEGQLMKAFNRHGVDSSVDKTLQKSGDCLSIEVKAEQRTKKTQRNLDLMDSIAYGVEAWFEEKTDYPRRVVETTLNIATRLGLPEAEVEKWAACRLIRYREKARVIKSLLERAQAPQPIGLKTRNNNPLRSMNH